MAVLELEKPAAHLDDDDGQRKVHQPLRVALPFEHICQSRRVVRRFKKLLADRPFQGLRAPNSDYPRALMYDTLEDIPQLLRFPVSLTAGRRDRSRLRSPKSAIVYPFL